MRKFLIGAAALSGAIAGAFGVSVATAQPNVTFSWERDFPRIFGRQNNPNLNCSVIRRINRQGDIVFLQLTCRR